MQKEIDNLKLEKDNNLILLGNLLISAQIIEIKSLESYINFKSTAKEINTLKSQLEDYLKLKNNIEENNKKIKQFKIEKEKEIKQYYLKIREFSEKIMSKYPENSYLLLKYEITTLDIENENNKKSQTYLFGKLINKIKNLYIDHKNSKNINNIQKQILDIIKTKEKDLTDLEKSLEELSGSTALSINILKSISSIKKLDEEIENRINIVNTDSRRNANLSKSKLEKDIKTKTQINNNNLIEISKGFIEKLNTDNKIKKNAEINEMIKKISEIKLKILDLEKKNELNIKTQKIEILNKKINNLNTEKENIESKIQKLEEEIKYTEKEIIDIDNK